MGNGKWEMNEMGKLWEMHNSKHSATELTVTMKTWPGL